MESEKKVIELNVNDILPNRFQPRIKFNEDSMNELCDSIREHGVLQPILVRKMGDKYEIIAGERRYKASLLANKVSIPAVVVDLNDKDSAEVALIENVQREDLTPIEEAISYRNILDMEYLTQEELANKLGKTQSTVANKLRLLNLDEDIQEALLEGKISERHARSLLKLNSSDDQKMLLEKIIKNRLTVRKTDEEIAKILNGEKEEENDKKDNVENNNIANIEKETTIEKPKELSDNTLNNASVSTQTINPFLFNMNNNDMDKNDDLVLNKNNESNISNNPFTDFNSLFNKVEEENENIRESQGKEEMNNTNNMNQGFFNNQLNGNQNSNSNEFNPFDMNTTSNSNFGIPVEPISESTQMQYFNADPKNASNEINVNNVEDNYSQSQNTINPGFLDIDKIQKEATDISLLNNMNNNASQETTHSSMFDQPMQQEQSQTNSMFGLPMQQEQSQTNSMFGQPVQQEQPQTNSMFGLPVQQEQTQENMFGQPTQQEQPQNNSMFGQSMENNQENGFSNIFQNENNQPLLKEQVLGNPEAQYAFENPEEPAAPGKFFNVPMKEEVNKNIEVPLQSNPFEFGSNQVQNVASYPTQMPTMPSQAPVSTINNAESNPFGMNFTNNEQEQKNEPIQNVPTFNQFNAEPINQMNNDYNMFNQPAQQEQPQNNSMFGLPMQQEQSQTNSMFGQPVQQEQPQTNSMFGLPVQQEQTQENMFGQPVQQEQPQTNIFNQSAQQKNINDALNIIHEAVDKIKSLGFNVNTEDFDFENMYQVMFRIEK